jgi:outer membrane PBP1 activator LpoA protein
MIPRLLSVVGLVFLALSGCHSKDKTPAPTGSASPAPAADQAITQDAAQTAAASAPTEAISAARDSLKAGNVDEAAAKLAQLQMQGATFNAQQAKDYRQTLSEAYDRAIEAAQRGDPKAQAALQLLRAAAPR